MAGAWTESMDDRRCVATIDAIALALSEHGVVGRYHFVNV
jgi:hypothetical protein